MKLIGITGLKGHGKDTAAAALTGFRRVALAAPLKGMLNTLLTAQGVPFERAWAHLYGDEKETPMEELGGKSARYALQTLGTEWGRLLVAPALWTDAFRRRAGAHERVVCTDVRFHSEATLIHDMGGVMVRINDPRKSQIPDEHASESMVPELDVDHEISNAGTVAELHAKIRHTFREWLA